MNFPQALKLSYCTVCMNRLNHLKVTLPLNLEENEEFHNVQFIVLDYNSQDGLESWIKNTLERYISSGKLVYYKNRDAELFHRSHSRNMAFKLANTDVVCNVDSDNIVTREYTQFVLKHFHANPNILITADTIGAHYFFRDVVGRICCLKKDFGMVQGFDETMSGYGFEDNDLISRIERLGRQRVVVEDISLLSAIRHQDADRVKNESTYKKMNSIYVLPLPGDVTKFIILLNDKAFIYGTVVPTKYKSQMLKYALKNKIVGQWYRNEDGSIRLNYTRHRNLSLVQHTTDPFFKLTDGTNNIVFAQLTDFNKIDEAMLMFMMVDNQEIYQMNNKQATIVVNKGGYGKGVVFKNFDFSFAVELN